METISLIDMADEKLAQARQAHSARAAHTIHGGHDHELRQTVLALAAGHELDEHDSPGEATLQVLHGHVRLSTNANVREGKSGDYVAIPSSGILSRRSRTRWFCRPSSRSFRVSSFTAPIALGCCYVLRLAMPPRPLVPQGTGLRPETSNTRLLTLRP
jgi:hypothetical protein